MNAKGDRKKYDESIDKDPRQRQIIKKFFLKYRNVILKDHACGAQDIPDLIYEDTSYCVEHDHRTSENLNWVSGKFPRSEVNIPVRKRWYLVRGFTYYCTISEDWSTVGIIHPDRVKLYTEEKKNPNRFLKNEYFLKVPKEEFEWYDIKSGQRIE